MDSRSLLERCAPGAGERAVTYRRVPAAAITPLIGRRSELAELRGLVGRERVVTLTGAGGCGKTRLAHELAMELVGELPGGVAWVDLASVAAGDGVVPAIADVLDLPTGPSGAGVRSVVAALERRPSNVVVLDNAEHVLASTADLVAAIVSGAPSTAMLITSREPIGVPGELVWRTPSLSLPANDGVARPAAEALGSEAVQLFVERARRARRGFTVTDANAAVVGQICVRLDGLPLAIELAAARVRSIPPERIAVELDRRFRLLTGGPRTVVERQQTLRASVAWSEDLLDDVERLVFRRIGVFHGGFTVDAASMVVASFGDVDAYDVADAISRLVDKSLVNLDDRRDRYSMLETIRSYTTERLMETGELAPARDAHVDWFASWLESVVEERDLGDVNAWWESRLALIGVIDPEWPNCLAALDWVEPSERRALRLVAGLGDYWALRQRASDSERYGMPAIWAGDRHDPAWLTAVLRLQAVRTNAGDARFEPIRAEAVELARTRGDRAAELRLGVAGHIAEVMVFGPVPSILDSLATVRNDARREGEWYSVWNASQSPAIVLTVTGRLADADELVAGLRSGRADWIRTSLAIERGHHVDPDEIGEAVRRQLEHRDGAALDRVVAVYAAAATALRLADRRPLSPVPLDDDVDDLPIPFATAHRLGQGVDQLLAGRLDEARRRFSARPPDLVTSWRLTVLLAETEAALGEFEAASATAARLADYSAGMEAPLYCAAAALVQSDVERAIGRPGAALVAGHESLAHAWPNGLALRTVDALEAIAVLLCEAGRTRDGARLLAATDVARESMPYRFRHQHRSAAIAGVIDEVRADVGWSDGRALTLDAAVELAQRMRGDRVRPATGWDSLTPTEQQVVEVVAAGLSNPQIAERLLMSRATVKTHLGHVFQKLGVRNRAELAAAVARRASP